VADEFAASLGVDAVGPHDDFFELGDDSLTAVQVAIAVGKRLGVNVPVPWILGGLRRCGSCSPASSDA
jgi:acyl carrier protein